MSTVNPRAPACTAKNDTCQNPAVAGSTVCRSHGGSAPQVRRAAKRRLAIAEADKVLRDLEYQPVDNPLEELADIAGQAKSLMEWSAARVAELSNDLDYRDAKDVDQLKAVVGLYERAMDRAARLVEACARLGLDERRVALEEATAELVVAAMQLAVRRAGLPVDQGDAVVDAFVVAVKELESANGELSK